MKKNKEKERQNKNKVSYFILTLVILSFLFLIFFLSILSLIRFLPKEGLINFKEEIENIFRISKNKFIIEKEECVNENYTLSLMASGERKLLEFMIERNITRCLKKEIVTPKEGFFKGVTFYFCDYNISYEQICEKKEVEEIDTRKIVDNVEVNKSYSCLVFTSSTYNRTKPSDLNNIKISCYSGEIISKKNLTKDWLSQNCECIVDGNVCEIIEDKSKTAGFNGCLVTTDYDCQKYKCFENYYVEII